jgi:hypothetical protein
MSHLSCPHCSMHFDADEMIKLPIDMYQLAKDEDETAVDCPFRKQKFYVLGKCKIDWNTYKTEEDMEYSR